MRMTRGQKQITKKANSQLDIIVFNRRQIVKQSITIPFNVAAHNYMLYDTI